MVFGRKGLGGPQSAEVERMLGNERAAIAADQAWLQQRLSHIRAADVAREQAFVALLR